jgi:hypothetical protein
MKTEDVNEGVFTFNVKPPLMTFAQMNLTNNVSLLCNSEYTVSEVSYSAGVLKVVVDYTQDMEGVECTLNIDYDPAVIESTNSSVDFQAISSNEQLLIMLDHVAQVATIKFLFKVLSWVILGVFLLSLPHKMIGLELLIPCQLVYFSYVFFQQSKTHYVLKSFKLVTSYRSMFYLSDYDQQLKPFSIKLELNN